MRTLVVWCPDWPVMAALGERPVSVPVAVLERNVVLACTPGARAEGVRRGMRRRDAQARCPGLELVDHRPEDDARRFEEVLVAIEELSPGVAPLRPGLCALAVPSRFYGGEAEAAAVLAERIVSLGVWDVRLGVADGLFAAEQAARRAVTQDCLVVPSGGTAAFLADLPIEALDEPDLVDLLRRLGLTTLGAFAALPATDVHTRFGSQGARLHALASGDEGRPVGRRRPPEDLEVVVRFEPPLALVEPIAFSVRHDAERLATRLADAGLVCTAVRVEVECDGVVVQSRRWVHPRWFGPGELVDRVRWQLSSQGIEAPVDAVRFMPEVVEPVGDHAESLFGGGVDEQVERGVARVQSLGGHEAVQVPQVQGGRDPGGRRHEVPWGVQEQPVRAATRPWPGSVPAPAPSTVYRRPEPAQVVGLEGQVVGVDGRGVMSAEPLRFRPREAEAWQRVAAWAGPWPVDERWWDEASARRVARFQVVGTDGSAWLMVVEDGQWFTEARYD